jgi:hypothetical protein
MIFGMPREAAATGCVDEVLPLPEIAVRLIRLSALEEGQGWSGPSHPGPGKRHIAF